MMPQKRLPQRLTELKATQRPIAKALGVSPQTINNDLSVKKLTPEAASNTHSLHENKAQVEPAVNNLTPPESTAGSWHGGFADERLETTGEWFQEEYADIAKQAAAARWGNRQES